jgi:predicted HTH domain antitoxin
MQVTVTLPDDIAEGLGHEAEARRRVMEALVLQRYLAEEISLGRVAELLSLSRSAAEDFLDRNNARLPYTHAMLEEDRRSLAHLLGSR